MKAIVTGINGQDGYLMTKKLLSMGSEVVGLTTDSEKACLQFCSNPQLIIEDFDYSHVGLIDGIVERHKPDLIFNFAAKASGQGMFDNPKDIVRINGGFVIDILEALRSSSRRHQIVFCQASSSEMYGHVTESPQNESTPFRPKSPYGAAKLYAHNMTNIYRNSYDVKSCSAILYNHESVRRTDNFVTKKIATAAAEIKLGISQSLTLGTLEAERDWGYAPEYVDAMFRMATATELDDYVVATGRLSSVRNICEIAFKHLGLEYSDYVKIEKGNFRSIESVNLCGNAEKIRNSLGWKAKKTIKEIMIELADHEVNRLSRI